MYDNFFPPFDIGALVAWHLGGLYYKDVPGCKHGKVDNS